MSTTYWADVYFQIKDRLLTQVRALVDDRNDPIFDAVYFGRRAALQNFPCAVIWAERTRPRVASVKTSVFNYNFRITVISKHAEPEEGSDDVIGRISRLIKFFENDRQFGGLADTTEIDEIEPDVERRRVRTRHEGAMIVRFMRYALPI